MSQIWDPSKGAWVPSIGYECCKGGYYSIGEKTDRYKGAGAEPGEYICPDYKTDDGGNCFTGNNAECVDGSVCGEWKDGNDPWSRYMCCEIFTVPGA